MLQSAGIQNLIYLSNEIIRHSRKALFVYQPDVCDSDKLDYLVTVSKCYQLRHLYIPRTLRGKKDKERK